MFHLHKHLSSYLLCGSIQFLNQFKCNKQIIRLGTAHREWESANRGMEAHISIVRMANGKIVMHVCGRHRLLLLSLFSYMCCMGFYRIPKPVIDLTTKRNERQILHVPDSWYWYHTPYTIRIITTIEAKP